MCRYICGLKSELGVDNDIIITESLRCRTFNLPDLREWTFDMFISVITIIDVRQRTPDIPKG